MNELTKRIVSCVLLLIIGLGCFFGISGWQSSPETHRTSIEYLNEKQATVMKLTAASTAASAAVSALPGDTGSAIAEKLADLTSDFLIVLCAIMLEKYLLTITGYAVFRFILPAVCVLLIVRQFRSSEILAKLAFKLALFGMAVWLAVPGGITVSRRPPMKPRCRRPLRTRKVQRMLSIPVRSRTRIRTAKRAVSGRVSRPRCRMRSPA